ncbi:MAG: hypothetical protein QXS04_05260 [Thermoproteota archaeon]
MDVDILIIGQPTVAFTPEEINAIKDWFNTGNKVVWIAADSDYGPGPSIQEIANLLLENIGSSLRIDLCAVEDPVQNAKKPYRVVANVEPDPAAEEVKTGVVNPVLYHGPALVAYVAPNGTWKPLEGVAPENIIRIVRTSKNGTIVENNPPPAKAHTAGDKGKLVLLAAEFITVGDKVNLVIASGESPYGDYEPTWASSYYGVPLSGPRFVVNMITWALNAQTNYNRMQTISKQKAKIIELQRNIESLQSQIRDLNDKVAKLEVEKNKQSLHESRGRNNNRTYNRDSNKTGTAKKKERLAIYLYFFISRLLA